MFSHCVLLPALITYALSLTPLDHTPHTHITPQQHRYNKKEDFYARISEAQDNRDNERKQLPFHLDYDVLVTNPPYSEPHVPRLLQVSLSLRLKLKGLFLYTIGILCNVDCCIRYLRYTALVFFNHTL